MCETSKESEKMTLDEIAAPFPRSFVDGPFGSNLKTTEYTSEGVRLIQLQNIGEGYWLNENQKFISLQKLKELIRHVAYPGDIAIAKMADPVARACLIPPVSDKFVVVADCIKLTPDKSRHDLKYLVYAINHHNVRHQAERKSTGTTRQRINLSVLKTIEVWTPKLKEQQKIAEILDTVDKAIALTQTHISKLKLAKAGLLHDLLTRGIDEHGELRNPTRNPQQFKDSPLGRIPKDWDVCVIDDVIDPNRPVVYGILMPGYGYSGGIPVIKVKDILNGEIKTDELLLTSPKIHKQYFRSRLETGDLLFTIRGTVGRTAFVSNSLEGANITQDTARLAIKKAHPYFVRQYLEMPKCKAFIDLHTLGQAVQGINLRDVRVIPLAIPSLQEQLRIVRILERQNSQIRTKENYLEKLKLLKLGLMSDLLTGKVRVKI